jgi:Ca2+-binding RTX toxin-like protein
MGFGLFGNSLDNVLTGNAGNDFMMGHGGDDTLIGLAGYDDLRGGDGDDKYYIDMTETGGGAGRWDWDVVIENNNQGSGIDTVYVEAGAPNPLFTHDDYQLPDNVENGVVTNGQHFWLVGNSLENSLLGDAGDDWLHGLGGSDTLDGSFGNDELIGGGGNDTLIGSFGRDTMWGDTLATGPFADTFVYTSASESGAGIASRDTIMDFMNLEEGGTEGADKIDFSAIDINTKQKGIQSFIFIDEAEFSSTRRKKVYGELRVENDEGFSVLQADLTGDGIADFEIAFDRVIDFTRDDFIL